MLPCPAIIILPALDVTEPWWAVGMFWPGEWCFLLCVLDRIWGSTGVTNRKDKFQDLPTMSNKETYFKGTLPPGWKPRGMVRDFWKAKNADSNLSGRLVCPYGRSYSLSIQMDFSAFLIIIELTTTREMTSQLDSTFKHLSKFCGTVWLSSWNTNKVICAILCL